MEVVYIGYNDFILRMNHSRRKHSHAKNSKRSILHEQFLRLSSQDQPQTIFRRAVLGKDITTFAQCAVMIYSFRRAQHTPLHL